MAVRRCKKADLKRIAKATGATLLSSMANLEGIALLILNLSVLFGTKYIFYFKGDESFEASSIGEAAEVSTERICDDELIIIKGYFICGS